jgi:hypothetical protein
MIVYVTSVKEDWCLFFIFEEIGYEKGDYKGVKMSTVAGAQVFVGASGEGGRGEADLSAGGKLSRRWCRV